MYSDAPATSPIGWRERRGARAGWAPTARRSRPDDEQDLPLRLAEVAGHAARTTTDRATLRRPVPDVRSRPPDGEDPEDVVGPDVVGLDDRQVDHVEPHEQAAASAAAAKPERRGARPA